MKKSEAYHLAQIAVVTSNCITPENKLKIIKHLQDDEGVAAYVEMCEEEEEKANGESV